MALNYTNRDFDIDGKNIETGGFYDINGIDFMGYNSNGFDILGFNPNGFHENGTLKDGYGMTAKQAFSKGAKKKRDKIDEGRELLAMALKEESEIIDKKDNEKTENTMKFVSVYDAEISLAEDFDDYLTEGWSEITTQKDKPEGWSEETTQQDKPKAWGDFSPVLNENNEEMKNRVREVSESIDGFDDKILGLAVLIAKEEAKKYDKYGYDAYGYDRDGYNSEGLDIDGLGEHGYDIDGYDINGFSAGGVNRTTMGWHDIDGLSQSDCNKRKRRAIG